MKPVTLYTTPFCGYCAAAKRLLTQKGVSFTEIDVSQDRARLAEMVYRAQGRHTVPQIFVGAEHIGGYDDMNALDRKGGLTPLIAD